MTGSEQVDQLAQMAHHILAGWEADHRRQDRLILFWQVVSLAGWGFVIALLCGK